MAGEISGVSIAGIRAASQRIGTSAHNLANLGTEDFRPQRATQVEGDPGGGPRVVVEQAAQPEPVDIAKEIVDMKLAEVQARASMRALDSHLDLIGNLLDTLA